MNRELQPVGRPNTWSISLAGIFQILTACCIFFACLKISPLLAIIGTFLAIPAIIRTTLASTVYQQKGQRFGWTTRVFYFVETLGIELVTMVIAILAFTFVCVLFGALAVGFSMLFGFTDSFSEIAIMGSAGGMMWGFGGAILAIGFSSNIWKIKTQFASAKT